MKRSISIINTEIQLINVIEAIHHFECTENYLVIGQFNIRMNRIQKIEKMLNEPLFKQHFKKIIHLPLYLSNKNPLRFLAYILAYVKFFFLILCNKKFDCCFFGVVTDIIVKPITYLTLYKNPQCTLCLIDEGTRTEAEANERILKGELIARQQKRKRLLFSGYCLAIIRKWIYPALTYFSIHKPSLLPQDSLIKNNYTFFKGHKISNISLDDNAVIIVGQPMYELHITTLEKYQKIIYHIVNKYANKHIYYAPHPIETEFHKWMSNQVSLIQTHYPLELVLMVNKVDFLIGFDSNVLINAASLKLCENIISIPIRDSSCRPDEKTKKANYEYHQLGIHVATVNFHHEETSQKQSI